MKSEICMPYIRIKDAYTSLAFYEQCLGFRKVSEHRFAPGLPLCIGIERGELRFLLTEHTGDGAFGICVYCYLNDDVDEFCRAAGAHHPGIRGHAVGARLRSDRHRRQCDSLRQSKEAKQ